MVTHEDVLQIARLAKLSIKEEELDALTKDMQTLLPLQTPSTMPLSRGKSLTISTIFPTCSEKTPWFPLMTANKFYPMQTTAKTDIFL